MEAYQIFRDLAIIILAAKFFGILARKFKAPSVVGEIIAGLIIGPSLLGLVQESDFTVMMAEIGVVLLMFSAGLETNLFRNRLSVQFNGFISNTDNLLTFQSLGFLSGLQYNWSNGGALSL